MVWNAVIGLGASLLGNALSSKNSAKQQQAFQAASLADAKALAKYQYDLNSKSAKTDFANQQKMFDYQQKGMLNASNALLKSEYGYNSQLMSQSAKATEALNQNLMDYQYNLERQSRQTSFQDTRKDLEGAGYNPLLAVGQQSNYTPVSSGVTADSGQVEQGNVNSQKLSMLSGIADTINQTSATRSQVKRNNILNENETQSVRANIQETLARAGQIVSATKGQELDNYIKDVTGLTRANAEIDKLLADTDLSRKQKEAVASEIKLNGVRSVLLNAQTATANAETGLANAHRQQVNSATKGQNIENERNERWLGVEKRHPYITGASRLGLYGAMNNFAGTLINAGSRIYGRRY